MSEDAEVPQNTETHMKELGRDFASHMMRSAVADAENDDQMNHQLMLLYHAAISVLATHAYNCKQQFGDPYEEIFHGIKCDLLSEMREMDDTEDEIEVVSRGGE